MISIISETAAGKSSLQVSSAPLLSSHTMHKLCANGLLCPSSLVYVHEFVIYIISFYTFAFIFFLGGMFLEF